MRLLTHQTKIVCTIGPASAHPETIERLIRAGMSIARLNLAHNEPESHAEIIRHIRAAAQRVERRVAILTDLPGPKLRIGKFEHDSVQLQKGQPFTLTTEPILGDAQSVSVDFAGLPEAVKSGDTLFLNDGFIQLRVETVAGPAIRCQVIVGGELRSHKGLNLPGVDFGGGAVTENDRQLLAFALRQEVDAVSVSFVQRAEDIQAVRRLAESLNHMPFIIAKIERAQAVSQIDSILEAADGIMVARGDLGVETPIEGIAMVQKQLIRKANLAGKPVITATQMLESMTRNRRPTRAEVTDVANAILDGTDAVMLSEESAMGHYPVEAVEMLARIAEQAEAGRSTQLLRDALIAHPPKLDGPAEEVIAWSAVNAAERLKAHFVIAPTESGATARRIARFRLPIWVLAFSPHDRTCQHLVFSYGVEAVRARQDGRGWGPVVRDWLRQQGLAEGLGILIQGPSPEHPYINNRLELIRLDDSP